jgi:hypothetical protein
MTSLNFIRKSGFSSNDDVKKISTIIERFKNILQSYDQIDINFNIYNLSIYEQTMLLDITRVFIFNGNGNEPNSFQTLLNYFCANALSLLISKVIYFLSLSSYLKDAYYLENNPRKALLMRFFSICDTLLYKVDIIVQQVTELKNKIAIKVEDLYYEPFNASMRFFIEIYHNSDALLFEVFKLYDWFSSHTDELIHIFDQYSFVLSEPKRAQGKLHDYYKLHKQEYFAPIIDSKNLNQTLESIDDFPLDVLDIRKLVLKVHENLEEIINGLIDHKIFIMEHFESEMHSGADEISMDFYDGFSNYLKRFYKIHKLKQEMFNSFLVTCSPEMKKPNMNALYGSYENIVVPNLIRDCHSELVAKITARSQRPELKFQQQFIQDNRGKKVVKKYKKSNFSRFIKSFILICHLFF